MFARARAHVYVPALCVLCTHAMCRSDYSIIALTQYAVHSARMLVVAGSDLPAVRRFVCLARIFMRCFDRAERSYPYENARRRVGAAVVVVVALFPSL